MIIHTNAPVNQPFYFDDRDGNPVPLDADATYRCSLKDNPDDDAAVLTFETGGATNAIEVITDTIDDVSRDLIVLLAPQSSVADLDPGSYFADLIRTDDPSFQFDFEVTVKKGITAP